MVTAVEGSSPSKGLKQFGPRRNKLWDVGEAWNGPGELGLGVALSAGK